MTLDIDSEVYMNQDIPYPNPWSSIPGSRLEDPRKTPSSLHTFTANMHLLTVSTFILAVIGTCVAEAIPAGVMFRPGPNSMTGPGRRPGGHFWACIRCDLECIAVLAGCTLVCVIPEVFQPELCGVSGRSSSSQPCPLKAISRVVWQKG